MRHRQIMTQSNETQYGQSHSPRTPRAPHAREEIKVTLHGPAELADALPFLMGVRATDSIVVAALHGRHGRFGGRVRLALPEDPAEWPRTAQRLAACLIRNSTRRHGRPDAVVVFLCREPGEGETTSDVVTRLRPLAQQLRVACGALDVPVIEALCLSAGRWWSYCRPHAPGTPGGSGALPPPGSTALAATAAYLGLPAPPALRDLESRLRPRSARDREQELALDMAAAELVPRMLADRGSGEAVARRTLLLARSALDKLRDAPPIADAGRSDRRDDKLLGHDEAASLILGLQDKEVRDAAAQWTEPERADAALRLWRALSRRCFGPYAEHAAAPLSLAGWVAWASGDEAEARAAFCMALDLEPHYTFARLLHEAVNTGVDPDMVRRSMRRARRGRVIATEARRRAPSGDAGRGPGRQTTGGRHARSRR